jgi:hypothetical protein
MRYLSQHTNRIFERIEDEGGCSRYRLISSPPFDTTTHPGVVLRWPAGDEEVDDRGVPLWFTPIEEVS